MKDSENSDHPLFVNSQKELTRFDLILMSTYSSIDSTRSFFDFCSNQTTNSLISNTNSEGSKSSNSQEIPEIRTEGCSPTNSDQSPEDDPNSRRGSTDSSSYCDSEEDYLITNASFYSNFDNYKGSACSSLSTIPEVATPGTVESIDEKLEEFNPEFGVDDDEYVLKEYSLNKKFFFLLFAQF